MEFQGPTGTVLPSGLGWGAAALDFTFKVQDSKSQGELATTPLLWVSRTPEFPARTAWSMFTGPDRPVPWSGLSSVDQAHSPSLDPRGDHLQGCGCGGCDVDYTPWLGWPHPCM